MALRFLLLMAVAGGAIGVLDLGAAALINGMSLETICRVVARGLLGKAAMVGGGDVVALGLLLQVAMSALIALIYGVASLRLPLLRRRWLLWGALYGVGIFLAMNYVVVPLSAIGSPPRFRSLAFAAQHLAAMLGFGLLVALSAQKLWRNR